MIFFEGTAGIAFLADGIVAPDANVTVRQKICKKDVWNAEEGKSPFGNHRRGKPENHAILFRFFSILTPTRRAKALLLGAEVDGDQNRSGQSPTLPRTAVTTVATGYTVARMAKLRQNEGMLNPGFADALSAQDSPAFIAWPVLLLYIYGILLIVGGAMGYVKARSVPSLVAGLVCGVIAILIGLNYTQRWAPISALILAIILIVLMGRRYLNTRKAMPALLIVVLSVIVALVQVYVMATAGLGHGD